MAQILRQHRLTLVTPTEKIIHLHTIQIGNPIGQP